MLLPVNTAVGLLGVLTIGGSGVVHLTEWSETILGAAYVLHQDIIDVLIRLLTVIRLHHSRHSLFKNDLELLLLLWCKILEVL